MPVSFEAVYGRPYKWRIYKAGWKDNADKSNRYWYREPGESLPWRVVGGDNFTYFAARKWTDALQFVIDKQRQAKQDRERAMAVLGIKI